MNWRENKELTWVVIAAIIATILANVGIDMAITNVICIDLPYSVEDMAQWAG